MESIPWPIWAIAAAAVLAAVHYARLARQHSHGAEAAERSWSRLQMLHASLQAHAEGHVGRFPTTLAELDPDLELMFVYRPIPNRSFDERLIVAYDRVSQHRLLDFPVLRDGRAVLLLGGKRLVFSAEQFEKLVVADNALREQVGLQVLEIESGQPTVSTG